MNRPSRHSLFAAALTVAAVFAGTEARADQHEGTMPGMDNQTMSGMADSASAQEMMAAMEKMQSTMPEMTGNADLDFAQMMIPHHQSAIDVAKVELEYGKDPEMRALAEAIITAQEVEIAQLQAWIEKNRQQ